MLNLSTKNTVPPKTFKQYETKLKKAKQSLLRKRFAEFLTLPTQNTAQIIKEATLIKKSFTDIVVIGMGGSILGAQMLFHTMQRNNSTLPRIHFIDNIDPDLIASFEKPLNNKKTLFIFVSKSGNTLETTILFDLIKKGSKHLAVITENKDGLLYKQAQKNNLALFEVPKYVAGRYSVLTATGLLPAALMDLKITRLLNGAAKAQIPETAERLAILIHYMYSKKKQTLALFPYIDCFEFFNKWAIQLIAESLGKTSRVGPLPIGLIGAKDQHSMLQLLLDGPKDKWVLFFTLKNREKDYIANGLKYSEILEAQKKGTAKALSTKKVPNATITLDRLDEENLGELIMTFCLAVALAGEMFKVNPFSQPAVELGKKFTRSILNK